MSIHNLGRVCVQPRTGWRRRGEKDGFQILGGRSRGRFGCDALMGLARNLVAADSSLRGLRHHLALNPLPGINGQRRA